MHANNDSLELKVQDITLPEVNIEKLPETPPKPEVRKKRSGRKPRVQPPVSLRKPAVVVSVDREDTAYVIGETIKFLIKISQQDAQVSLRDAEGEFRFPSPPQQPLLVKEGTAIAVACQSAGTPGTKRVIITATAVGGHSDQPQMSTQEVTLYWPDIRPKHVSTTPWHCQVL